MVKNNNLMNLLSYDEKQLIKVLETAIKNAQTIEQVEEAKQCIGKIMAKIPNRMKKDKSV